ncbi:MAG: glycosyltransferase family 39 protein [Candidatus Omnitrophota bacterium]
MESIYLSKKEKLKIIFLTILITAIFIRGLSLFVSDNFHGIASGKILQANKLAQNPYSFYNWIVPAHGPLHLYSLCILGKLFDNSFIAPRILSLLMGILSLVVYYQYIKLWLDKETALVCFFCAAFFSLHIIHSVLTTAETMFLFLLFSGAVFFARYKKNENINHLYISALLVGASSMCRFEGVIYGLIFSLFLIRSLKIWFRFICLLMLLPVIWLIFNYVLFGDFLFFLKASDAVVQSAYNTLQVYGPNVTVLKKIFYWPKVLKNYFGWPIFILGVTGFWFGLKEKKYKLFFSLLFGMLLVFIFKTARGELAMQPRYGMSLGFLFLPFFAGTFKILLRKVSLNQAKCILAVFFLYIIFKGTYLTFIGLPHTPPWLKEAAKFLAVTINKESNEAIYVDCDDNNFKEPLKAYSRLEARTFVGYERLGGHTELLEPQDINRLRYIVLVSDKRNFKNLKLVFKSNKCKIYDFKNAD